MPGYAADVDDVAFPAIGPLLVDLEDFLCHVYEPGHVGREHDVYVFRGDVGGLGDAFDEAAVYTPLVSKVC